MSNYSAILAHMGVSSAAQRMAAGSFSTATSTITVEIKGLRDLDAALSGMPGNVARKTLVFAIRAAAEVFRARAVALAPFNPDVPLGRPAWRTLRLRDGIKIGVRVKSLGVIGSRLIATIGLDKKHAFFGRYIEKGWMPAHGTRAVLGHPYMRPAFEEMKEAALQLFKTQLQAGIDRAAKELFRKAA